MNVTRRNNGLWGSVLPLGALTLFILMALACTRDDISVFNSLFLPEIDSWELNDGRTEETHNYSPGKLTNPVGVERSKYILRGEQDNQKRWEGLLTIRYIEYDDKDRMSFPYTEEVNMYKGLRHGPSTITLRDGTKKYAHYYMGKRQDWNKAARDETGDPSFLVFTNQYPWYQYKIHPLGFGDDYMESFLDTLDQLLEEHSFGADEFDEYYEDACDMLSETPYDSILDVNQLLSFMHGRELLKDSEFRLAVIDAQRQASPNTYGMIQSRYPGTLDLLDEAEVGEADFNEFCRVFDSCVISYGPLDVGDFHFVDSVDARIFRAIMEIYFWGEEEAGGTGSKLGNECIGTIENREVFKRARKVFSIMGPSDNRLESADVAEVMLYFMFMDLIEGDYIKKSVQRAWNSRHQVETIPELATSFVELLTSTSVNLEGFVFEDGGSGITDMGIVWAEHYNPSLTDQVVSATIGTGMYQVELGGLTEGNTYYARSYAVNAMGTAFGNCIQFTPTASGSSSIREEEVSQQIFIYPNPASGVTHLKFTLESQEVISLTITDLKGQVVYKDKQGHFGTGENLMEIDLSGMSEGVYFCQLSGKGSILYKQKLVISR